MIRHESVITALIGAALGLPLGLLLAALVTQALSDDRRGVRGPRPGACTSSYSQRSSPASSQPSTPLGRASRLNVLKALHYE